MLESPNVPISPIKFPVTSPVILPDKLPLKFSDAVISLPYISFGEVKPIIPVTLPNILPVSMPVISPLALPTCSPIVIPDKLPLDDKFV